MDWIPVSEKLPSSSGEYIVTYIDPWTNDRRVSVFQFEADYALISEHPWGFWSDENGKAYWCAAYDYEIVAWANMPGPYKGDKTNE